MVDLFVVGVAVAVVGVGVGAAVVAIVEYQVDSEPSPNNQLPAVHTPSHETLALCYITLSTAATKTPSSPSTCAPIHGTSNQSQAKHDPPLDISVERTVPQAQMQSHAIEHRTPGASPSVLWLRSFP